MATKPKKAPPAKRVRTYTDPVLSMRAPSALIKKIDVWAKKQGHSRSEAIRMLLAKALK